MGIGGGIALIVIGAILSFGVSDAIDGVNLTVIGYICMGAGVIALILAIVFNAQRSNTSHTAVVEQRTTPNAPPAQAAPVAQPVQPVQAVQPVQQQQPPAAPPAV
jgi:tellurite resistance protein TehA-like permease